MKVLITGASSGIGKDFAYEFAKQKYQLILVARDKNKLEKVREDLTKKYSANVKCIYIDLENEKNCFDLYEKERDIDILINNAGFGDYGFFDETDIDKDLAMIRTNIIAVHILSKLYLKEMKKRNSGKILNVASIAGFLPGPLMATYYATKNYVVKLSEGIREELKKEKSKVQISILCPGPVKTNFNNVANVKFEIRSLSSDYVANYAIKKLLKGKFYILPGFDIKVLKFLSKIVPTKLLSHFTYYTQKKKSDK